MTAITVKPKMLDLRNPENLSKKFTIPASEVLISAKTDPKWGFVDVLVIPFSDNRNNFFEILELHYGGLSR